MSYLRSMERQPGPLRKAGLPEQGSRLLYLLPSEVTSCRQDGDHRYFSMAIDTKTLKPLIADELARTEDTPVTTHIRSLLVEMMLQSLPIGSLVLALPALARWQ